MGNEHGQGIEGEAMVKGDMILGWYQVSKGLFFKSGDVVW